MEFLNAPYNWSSHASWYQNVVLNHAVIFQRQCLYLVPPPSFNIPGIFCAQRSGGGQWVGPGLTGWLLSPVSPLLQPPTLLSRLVGSKCAGLCERTHLKSKVERHLHRSAACVLCVCHCACVYAHWNAEQGNLLSCHPLAVIVCWLVAAVRFLEPRRKAGLQRAGWTVWDAWSQGRSRAARTSSTRVSTDVRPSHCRPSVQWHNCLIRLSSWTIPER